MFARRFRLPPPERELRPWWTAASVAIHFAALALLTIGAGRRFLEERSRPMVIQLLPPPQPVGPREYEIPAVPSPVVSPPAAAPVARALRPLPQRDTVAVGVTEVPREVPVGIPAEPDTALFIGPARRIGPSFGEGRVWVRPLEAELGVVGTSPSVAEHVARVDSALRARILAFIDSMPRDSFAPAAAPKWTVRTEGGETWGVDSKWIYLGDFKLPAALLALIPFPQGNYYEAKAEAELQRIRADIIRAARAAENAEDFRHYVEQVRKRKQAERDAERARRAAPRDTVVP